MAPVTCVLYHNIGVETKFEAGLDVTTSQESFAAQIEWLARNYDVIDLDTLINGNLPRKALLISFDDCFRSVMEVAQEILHPKGLPSVYFINTGLLGPDKISLDSVLAWCASTVGLARICEEIGSPVYRNLSELIRAEISTLSAGQRAVLGERLRKRFQLVSFAGRSPVLSRQDAAELHKYGVEIGNHTSSHVHCRTLKGDEFNTEIISAKKQLEALSGARVRSFAAPYGHERDLTPEVVSALRASGHEAIFLVHGRSNAFRPASDIWYRVSLHNEMPSSLPRKLRLLPILRSMKHLAGG